MCGRTSCHARSIIHKFVCVKDFGSGVNYHFWSMDYKEFSDNKDINYRIRLICS